MRFPQNTLRTGVNTRTPTCTVEHLCPPVLWRGNYPALIANTNISLQSNFPLKVINTLHKHFYWRREVVGAVHMGGARVRTCMLTHFNTWLPSERGSVWTIKNSETLYGQHSNNALQKLGPRPSSHPRNPAISHQSVSARGKEPLTRSNMTFDPLMQTYIVFFRVPPHVLVHCHLLALKGQFTPEWQKSDISLIPMPPFSPDLYANIPLFALRFVSEMGGCFHLCKVWR